MAVATCERCGADLPEDARFCPRCGAPVGALTTAERKVVTVLFADLADSTTLAARLDPERYREVISAFYELVSRELDALRGRAEKFVGDAAMAVFGVPQAHDDDALRAVRAALRIRDLISRLGHSLGLAVPLHVRIGINSGPVATGSGPSDQLLVSGGAVNAAVRLQQAGERGEILVGETTWHLTRHTVEYGPPRGIAGKGFDDEIQAWPVLSLSSLSTRRSIPLVGRRRELALLSDSFERVRDTSRAHLVTLLGEPGIGKTRLVEEFLGSLPEDTKVLSGRTSVFEEEVTFAPLAEMIRRELGLERDAPHEDVRRRLDEVVTGCCDPSEADRVAGRLGLALGLGEEEGETQRYRGAEIRAGFVAFVQGLARRGPAVLVFEDVHLARPALLELVEYLVRHSRRVRLLVLCLARDELLEVKPDWAGGLPDSFTLRLEPLSWKEAKELAEAAGESLDAPTAERIAFQAGGNPFFIIETTGMLLHERVHHHALGFSGRLLPPTVQAVVASRIDHLEDEARVLFRKAAVFSRSRFTLAELSLVTEPDENALAMLEDEELLVRDPEQPATWRFRHEMLRDVAYETLPKRERLRLHLQVAEGLTREGEDRHRQAIAYHLEQAARASLDLDPADRTVADRAVRALVRAGDQTRRRMELRTAMDLYERALALAGARESWGRREARIVSSLGEAHYWLGEFDEAESLLERALRLAGDDSWTLAHASRFLGDVALNARGDPDRATALFDQALAAARELGDRWAMARTLLMSGWAPYWRGNLGEARAMFEEALSIARANPEGDPWGEARALTALTSVVSPVGDEEESLGLAREALSLGREMGDPFTVAVANEHIGNSLRRMWRLDEALPHVEAALRGFRDLGARWEVASALGDRGELHRLSGRLTEAEGDLRQALSLCQELGERSLIAWTASALAIVLLALGDREAAREVLDDPQVELGTREPNAGAAVLSAGAVISLAEGDRDLALEKAAQALEKEKALGWPNSLAKQTWWMGRLFGPDVTGGEEALEAARTRLEQAHWLAALREPDLVAEAAKL